MGSSQRLAAAVSHARLYNHTQHDGSGVRAEAIQYNVNVFFISATLCGVLVAVCAACWRRSMPPYKPAPRSECARGVFTVSGDPRMTASQTQEDLPGPPPAYDLVVQHPQVYKDYQLEEVVTEPCHWCPKPSRPDRMDSGLPSYEAAVMLPDTKL